MDNLSGIPSWLKSLVLFTIIVAVLVIGAYGIKFYGPLATEQETWGQFGDFVGGTMNPLFAFSGLMALLYTIVLQSRELKNSAEQLKKSAFALEGQNELLTKQSFEATYFQLLQLYGSVVRGLSVTTNVTRMQPNIEVSTRSTEDRECLKHLYERLVSSNLVKVSRGDHNLTREQAINVEYLRFYSTYGHVLGHYFRTLYNIVKFVDEASITENEKQKYVKLLRAQLSKYELALMLYNMLSEKGRTDLVRLAKKYNLLKHLEPEVLEMADDILLFDGVDYGAENL